MISISILPQLLFPDSFFFWNHTISSQGSILKNPIGNFIWRSGIIIIALLKFPDVMFIGNKLESVSKEITTMSKVFGLIASTGFVLVAIFPEEIRPLHGICAFICFFGYFIMINLNLIIIGLELKNKNSPNYQHLIKNCDKIRLLYILLDLGFIFMVISSFIESVMGMFPLWEWFYLFCLILWFLIFPTFLEQGKEIVVFEMKTSNIVKWIKSGVAQMSLFVCSFIDIPCSNIILF